MEKDYIEAILIWSGAGQPEDAVQWFADRGFSTVQMTAGLLVAGGRNSFEAAFDVDLAAGKPPVTLSVPKVLKEAVTSIIIPKPREYQEGGI